MNRSWNSNSNPTGFVYFNVNDSYQNKSDTSDFLSFGDSPSYGSPKFNRFSPNNYSSPQKFHNSPRPYNKRNNYRFSGGQYSRSFNNSPNSSYNSSYNNNSRRRDSKQNSKSNGENDKKCMSKYFDHTSVQDPWKELEENLRKKREAKILENSDAVMVCKEETTVTDNGDSSSESDEGTESESKSCSSGVDEETT